MATRVDERYAWRVENFSLFHAGGSLLDGVSAAARQGEIIGIVGESGSGKSLLIRSSLGLAGIDGARATGSVSTLGFPVDPLHRSKGLASVLRTRVATIWQDPMSALHPVVRVGRQLMRRVDLAYGDALDRQDKRDLIRSALAEVGLADTTRILRVFPYELSGGMCQRVLIASAIATNCELMFADEPTSSLDVTVQKQVVCLLERLQAEHGFALVLVSHDLRLVACMADRIYVMRNGQVLAEGRSIDELASGPDEYAKHLIVAGRVGR